MKKKILCFIVILFAAVAAVFGLASCGKKDSETSESSTDIVAEIPYVSDFTCDYYAGKGFNDHAERSTAFGSEDEVLIKLSFILSPDAFKNGKRRLTIKPILSEGFYGNIVSANTSSVNDMELTAAYDADDRTAKNCTIEVKTKFNFYDGVIKIYYAYDEDDYQTTGSYNLLCGRTLKFTYDAMTDGYIVDKDTVKYSGDQNWLKQIETLAIPNTFNGKPVTGISDGMLSGCSSLKELTLPDGLVYVGETAFWNCWGLKYNKTENGGMYLGSENNDYLCLVYVIDKGCTVFSIDENCRVICDEAFSECASLSFIILPDVITRIGAQAFRSCDSLTNVYVPEGIMSVGADAFMGCGNLEYNLYAPLKFLGDAAERRKYTVLVDGRNSVGMEILRMSERCVIADEAYAGSEISQFENVAGNLIIGNKAFKNCKNLTYVSIFYTEKIGNRAFEGCAALATVRIGDQLKSIGENVFKDCKSLSNIEFAGTLEEWERLTAHLGQVSDDGAITLWCLDGQTKTKFDLF